jgi:hypothetical protein
MPERVGFPGREILHAPPQVSGVWNLRSLGRANIYTAAANDPTGTGRRPPRQRRRNRNPALLRQATTPGLRSLHALTCV